MATREQARDAETALYYVVDLSGGPSASEYRLTWLTEIPTGGWTDEHKTTKLVLRKITAGTYTMGSPTTPTYELGRWPDEVQHSVTLNNDFWMGVFPVTQRQWELVTGERPSYFRNDGCYAARPVESVSYAMVRGVKDGVNWPTSMAVDADSFLGVLRNKVETSPVFDIPTEAQWEYACRAGRSTALNSGQNLTVLKQDAGMGSVGRYLGNGGATHSLESGLGEGTAKVGSYVPNDWGLYDMHGNVMEWCRDWYNDYTYDTGNYYESYKPDKWFRSARGGCWHQWAYNCRSATRGHLMPTDRSGSAGLRLVIDEAATPDGIVVPSV